MSITIKFSAFILGLLACCTSVFSAETTFKVTANILEPAIINTQYNPGSHTFEIAAIGDAHYSVDVLVNSNSSTFQLNLKINNTSISTPGPGQQLAILDEGSLAINRSVAHKSGLKPDLTISYN